MYLAMYKKGQESALFERQVQVLHPSRGQVHTTPKHTAIFIHNLYRNVKPLLCNLHIFGGFSLHKISAMYV